MDRSDFIKLLGKLELYENSYKLYQSLADKECERLYGIKLSSLTEDEISIEEVESNFLDFDGKMRDLRGY